MSMPVGIGYLQPLISIVQMCALRHALAKHAGCDTPRTVAPAAQSSDALTGLNTAEVFNRKILCLFCEVLNNVPNDLR